MAVDGWGSAKAVLAKRPQRLKPHSKQCRYRSAEALRHPKASF